MGYRTGEQMRRVVCLMIAVIMIFSVDAVDVSAAKKDHQREGRSEWRQEDYERVNHTLNYLGYGEDDKVYYTEFQETVKEENKVKYVSFIYDDERAIGQYIKEETDDDVNECFIINKESELLNSLIEYHEGREFEITNEAANLEVATDGAENKQWMPIKEGSAKYLTSFADTGEFIPAGFIENQYIYTSYEISGLCWAACGASISNYYRNTSYNAKNVYDIVKSTTGLEYPEGTPAIMKCMFGKLGIFYTYLERRLTYSEALKKIGNDTLVMYGVQGADGGHAILLCGVFKIYSNYGFIYMDPNVNGGYVLNYNEPTVANTTTGNFYYYNGTNKLFTWISCTFCDLEKHYTIK